MLNNLASLINQEGSLNFLDACIYGLVGFALLFVGILIIILIKQFIGFIMKKTNNLAFITQKKSKNKAKKQEAAVHESNSDDGETVPDEVKAAIVAAIMAYYTAEKPKC